MKIIKLIVKLIAIILSLAQIVFIIYFLFMYSTDNATLFIFLLIVPLVNIFVIIFINKH